MPVNDELGIRMKTYYEQIPKTKLMRRTPVAIRIDGKSFHTFTKGFQKPFDEILIKSMQETMKYLCENIQGCVLGYTQSDEITLILVDYKSLNSDAWFDYEVQKMCSISSSMATMAFNKFFIKNCYDWSESYIDIDDLLNDKESKYAKLFDAYSKAVEKGAMFDARCFNIPKEEVTNLIYWRQLDATRNSIQMVGQANFSHNELHGKSCNIIQDMLMTKKDINWNDFPTHQKRGSCCIKEEYYPEPVVGHEDCDIDASTIRTRWIIDNEIPIFKGEDRNYIDKLIFI
jgi:tRNA(His) 5'-end guanylyltransferase